MGGGGRCTHAVDMEDEDDERPALETKREYVEEWQRNTLIATTSSYHNLVIRWNMGTLPQGATNPPRAMEHTMYYLMDDEQTDLSIIVLGSEWSSKN